MSALLSLDNVSVAYDKAEAVRKASLVVQPGRIVTVIGPNGAGKTTLLMATIGLLSFSGRIAFDGLLAHTQRKGHKISRSAFLFGHGAEYTLPGGLQVITSFHPSLQNTNTGRLTRPMFLNVFKRARQLAGL